MTLKRIGWGKMSIQAVQTHKEYPQKLVRFVPSYLGKALEKMRAELQAHAVITVENVYAGTN